MASVTGRLSVNAVPCPGRLVHVDGAAERVDRAGHDVEPHAPPRQRRHPFGGGEPGDEDQAVQLRGVRGADVHARAPRPWPGSRPRRGRGRRRSPGSRSGRRPTAAWSRSMPSAGFPAFARSSGRSMPWATALLSRCSSGSPSRSSTALSSEVSPPVISTRTFFPSPWAMSRTIRGKRPNTVDTGSSRVSISVDFEPLERLLERSDRLVELAELLAGPDLGAAAGDTASTSAECWIRPSPSTSSSASSRRKSTRTTLPRVGRRRSAADGSPLGLPPVLGRHRLAARWPRPESAAPARRTRAAAAPSVSRRGLADQIHQQAAAARPAARRRPRRARPAAPPRSAQASSSAWARSCIGVRPIIAELPLTVWSRPFTEPSRSRRPARPPASGAPAPRRRRRPAPRAAGTRRCSPAAAPRRDSPSPLMPLPAPPLLPRALDQPLDVGRLERLPEVVPGADRAAAGLVLLAALGGHQRDRHVRMEPLRPAGGRAPRGRSSRAC